MKLTDDILKKIGADKLLHFAFAGWGVSAGLHFGVLAGAAVWLILTILSLLKEQFFDKSYNKKDIIAAEAGMVLAFLLYFLTKI